MTELEQEMGPHRFAIWNRLHAAAEGIDAFSASLTRAERARLQRLRRSLVSASVVLYSSREKGRRA